MKTETKTLTAKDFALYYGCDVQVANEGYINNGYIGKMIGLDDDRLLVQHPKGSDGWEKMSDCKLALRSLSSMTENEAVECYELIHKCAPKDSKYDNWHYITETLTDQVGSEVWQWAISKRFDIMGFIKDGFAIEQQPTAETA